VSRWLEAGYRSDSKAVETRFLSRKKLSDKHIAWKQSTATLFSFTRHITSCLQRLVFRLRQRLSIYLLTVLSRAERTEFAHVGGQSDDRRGEVGENALGGGSWFVVEDTLRCRRVCPTAGTATGRPGRRVHTPAATTPSRRNYVAECRELLVCHHGALHCGVFMWSYSADSVLCHSAASSTRPSQFLSVNSVFTRSPLGLGLGVGLRFGIDLGLRLELAIA